MNIILENIIFIIPATFYLGSFLRKFSTHIRHTSVLSRFKHQTVGKWAYGLSLLAVTAFAYLEFVVMSRHTYSTFFLMAYLIIILGIQGSALLVTEEGFFVKGIFVEWAEISGLSEEDGVLKIQRRVKGHFEIRLKHLESQDELISLINQKRQAYSTEKTQYEFKKS